MTRLHEGTSNCSRCMNSREIAVVNDNGTIRTVPAREAYAYKIHGSTVPCPACCPVSYEKARQKALNSNSLGKVKP